MFPAGITVTIEDASNVTDQYGDTVETKTTRYWGPCAVAPRAKGSETASSERTDPRSPAVITGMTVYGPPVDLGPNDRLRINGRWYKVEGEPGDWRSPYTGWQPGIEVAVSRWEQP